MKICFVGPSNSAHIKKWCNWFCEHGHEVHVISFASEQIKGAKVHTIDIGINTNGSDFGKLRYLFTGHRIKKILSEIQPDIVSVHYATSYGMAVALSGINQYVLSVWGADVYDFPRKSIFHEALLRFSLKRANYIFSTSRAMAKETNRYTNKKIEVTPFGVDMNLFNPAKRKKTSTNTFLVGTIKALSDKYGIRNILEAVASIKKEGIIPIQLRIAGKGPQEQEYRDLARELGIDDITTWLGFISQDQAAIEWANMDVAIIPSTLESESFGVSAVEAQACGTAVIISDIPGLMEATNPGESSLVVRRNNTEDIIECIKQLYFDEKLLKALGIKGREYASEHYEIGKCFEHIYQLFCNMLR